MEERTCNAGTVLTLGHRQTVAAAIIHVGHRLLQSENGGEGKVSLSLTFGDPRRAFQAAIHTRHADVHHTEYVPKSGPFPANSVFC
jgi:hypothetical protein